MMSSRFSIADVPWRVVGATVACIFVALLTYLAGFRPWASDRPTCLNFRMGESDGRFDDSVVAVFRTLGLNERDASVARHRRGQNESLFLSVDETYVDQGVKFWEVFVCKQKKGALPDWMGAVKAVDDIARDGRRVQYARLQYGDEYQCDTTCAGHSCKLPCTVDVQTPIDLGELQQALDVRNPASSTR